MSNINEGKKALSITEIMQMRERAALISASKEVKNDIVGAEKTNIHANDKQTLETELPITEERKKNKVSTGETGNLYLKETEVGKDIELNVAGTTVKVSANQMNEFLARTSHNNVGELSEADKKIVNNMELGIHADATDDRESIQLGQNAIAGMINSSRKKIEENIVRNEESENAREERYNEDGEEDRYPKETVNTKNLYDENLYGDEDDETPVHTSQNSKGQSIEDYVNTSRGIDKVQTQSKDTEEAPRIETFKADNTGVAEIKINKFSEGLNSIKILPFNGKKIVKQRVNTRVNGKKTPVCALSSNIFCEVSGFSYSDLTQLNAERTDAYTDRKRQLEVLFEKINNPNVPLNFNTFLRATSIYDEEAFYFGAFKSTFGSKVKIPLTCQHKDCKHSFTFEIDADDLIVSKDYITMGDKVKEIMSMSNIKDLEESDVNKIQRFRLSSGHIIDIRHPSLYTLLERTIKLISNSKLTEDPKYGDIIELLPFISALYVPVVPEGDTRLASEIPPSELNFIEISIDDTDKIKTARTKLEALCDEILILGYDSVLQISKFVMDRVTSIQEQFSMGIVDAVCPKCGKPLGAPSNGFDNFIPIKIRELIFLNQLHQLNEVSMN